MSINDYNSIIELFKNTPGVTVRDADSIESTKLYLERNPNLSFVKEVNGEIIGCVMSGHDGRRGYLQHLVVSPSYRKQGFGKELFESSIKALNSIGIIKTHIFVFKTNSLANSFWSNSGWELRTDLNMYSFNSSNNNNA